MATSRAWKQEDADLDAFEDAASLREDAATTISFRTSEDFHAGFSS